MFKSFKKYATATALSLPLLLPTALDAQSSPITGAAPPVACEKSPTLGALNDCLATALPISDSVRGIVAREAGLARQAFDSLMAGQPRATAQRLYNQLGALEQANITACNVSRQSASAFNDQWNAALEAYPGFGVHDNEEELPFIDTTPGLRLATRAYVLNSAECLATGVDTLKFMMEKNGASTQEVRATINPLYRSIHSYRTFNAP